MCAAKALFFVLKPLAVADKETGAPIRKRTLTPAVYQPEGDIVDCPRCNGTMIEQEFTDILNDSGRIHEEMWRCMTCGEVCDPVILANRARRPKVEQTQRGRTRKPVNRKKAS